MRDEAADTAEWIRARVGPLLDAEGAPEGWTERARGADRVWTRAEADGPAWFLSEGALPGPVRLAAALIKEASLGGLAGDLRRWRAHRVSPCVELVSYTSRLPWPLADRCFSVVERYGGGPDEAWILGEDADDASLRDLPEAARAALAAERPEPDATPGRVLCSAYRLRPAPGGCQLRRLTRIELGLPLPRTWTEALLARTFLDDLDRLRAGLARPPAGLAATMDQDPIYRRW